MEQGRSVAHIEEDAPARSLGDVASGRFGVPAKPTLLSKISLEPLIFLVIFFNSLMSGSQQTDNLLLDHICRVDLGHGEDTCANRTHHSGVEVEVQKVLNM